MVWAPAGMSVGTTKLPRIDPAELAFRTATTRGVECIVTTTSSPGWKPPPQTESVSPGLIV